MSAVYGEFWGSFLPMLDITLTTLHLNSAAVITIKTLHSANSQRVGECNNFEFAFTSRGGRMSRAPAFHSGRSGNPKIAGLSPDPAALKPDQVKPMTFKLILVAS